MKRCLLLLSVLLLAACGSSGALYLPDQAPKHDNPLKKDQRKAPTEPQASPVPDQTSQPPAPAPEPTTPTPQP